MSNMANSLPSHGVPSLISEIVTTRFDSLTHKTVRVVGRVVKYDATKNLASLVEPTQSSASPLQLLVDTTMTESSDYLIGSLVMLIGELEEEDCVQQPGLSSSSHPDMILKARISRCVDRLDYTLYCKTLKTWRDFLSLHFSQ